MASTTTAKSESCDPRATWDAWARELAELRTECEQLGEIFENLWSEMDQVRSDLAHRTEQHEQLRSMVQDQQRQLVARNDALQQSVARMEERQQQFAEIFSELLVLREDRRRKG